MLEEEVDLGIENATQRYTASIISEQLVDSTLFRLPDYKSMTMEEYSNKLLNDKNFSAQLFKELGIEELKVETPAYKPKRNKWKDILDVALTFLNVANDAMNNINSNINVCNTSTNNNISSGGRSSLNYQAQYDVLS